MSSGARSFASVEARSSCQRCRRLSCPLARWQLSAASGQAGWRPDCADGEPARRRALGEICANNYGQHLDLPGRIVGRDVADWIGLAWLPNELWHRIGTCGWRPRCASEKANFTPLSTRFFRIAKSKVDRKSSSWAHVNAEDLSGPPSALTPIAITASRDTTC